MLDVHHLTREATPGAPQDLDGQTFTRLGVIDAAHYLIRPDGHIGYRSGGTDLDGLRNYLTRWLPTPRHGQLDQGNAPRRSHQSKAATSTGDLTPLRALAITDEASPLALRSTRNSLRRAMRQGVAWPGRRSDRAGAW
jgi:hypothetical protein